MNRINRVLSLGASLTLLLAMQVPALATASATQTLVIGVDHVDMANQQPFPPFNRLFEYTDFFSREVVVHKGDTLDFRAAPGSFHIVALAKREAVARTVYPVAFADKDGGLDTATGSGTAKLGFGPSNFPITGGSTAGGGVIDFTRGFGPPDCGDVDLNQPPCSFAGGNDIEIAGPNPGLLFAGNPPQPVVDPKTHQPILKFVDWKIQVNAAPGNYAYFCYIHPGMRGKVTVVDAEDQTTTQSQIDARSAAQFRSDRARALDVEEDGNVIRFTGGAPGTRTYWVRVGASAADNHVAIDEMLPNKPIPLDQGDQVKYVWPDPHNFHSVRFPDVPPTDTQPFGFDCGGTYNGIPMVGPPPVCLEPGDTQFEVIGDPGTSPPGTLLANPATTVDAGVLGGSGYGVSPSSQSWSVRTDATSTQGTYSFHCTIHDWMVGTLTLTA